MKIKEFCEQYICGSNFIKVVSAYNEKILCKNFNPKKHTDIGERELIGVYPEIKIQGNTAIVGLCLYANGAIEYEKENKQKIAEAMK